MSEEKQRAVAFDEACNFVIELGVAAQAYGCSTPRLEGFLTSLMKSFGYQGTFLSTPNWMIFAFQEADDIPQRVHVLTSPGTGLNLDRLARVGGLVDAVASGQTSIGDALDALKEISKTPAPWGHVASAISYAAVGAGVAGVLLGSWWDIVVATPLSLLVYGMVVASGRFGSTVVNWLPLNTAFVVGVLAALTKLAVPELNVVLAVLSAVAVLLPGYTISEGTMEMVGGHVISGNINIMSGLVYLLKQFVGAWIGVGIVFAAADPHSAAGTVPELYWQWLFVPALCIGLCLAFQTSRRDFAWACLSCAIAYVGFLAGAKLFGANLGNLLGAIIAVVFSNAWSTRTGRPTSIVLVPAVILLVSGTIGFRGLASLASGDASLGEQQILHMFLVALTIGAGLIVGNTISRPKVTL